MNECPNSTVSAIISSRNQDGYIGEAVESVLAQSLPPGEILVADDASSDHTRTVLERYAGRITPLLHRNNLGRPASMNRAVEQARGDYVAFLDGDDMWMPRHVEVLAGLLDRHPDVGMSFCRVEMFGDKAGIWPGGLPECGEGADLLLNMLRHGLVIPSACMIRRELFLDLGGFDPVRMYHKKNLLLVDDYDLFLKIALTTRIAGTMEVLARYRIHAGQNSRSRVPMQNAAIMQALRMLNEHAQHPRLAPILSKAWDRVCMQWEEYLHDVCADRNWRGLWQMMIFGMRNPSLRAQTARYLAAGRLWPAARKALGEWR